MRGGGLPALLLASLAVHVLVLLQLSGPAVERAPRPRPLDFELLAPRAAAVPAPPAAVAERPAEPPVDPDAPPPEDVEAAPARPAPEPRPPAVVRRGREDALDLRLPEAGSWTQEPSDPATGVFDPRLDARIREARAAPRPPVAATGAPRLWASGEGRTRIETERGCFERVTDPFDEQAGEQWWFVACGRADEEIDWGARFRARP